MDTQDRPVKLEVDLSTGEEKYIELTDEEIATLEANKLESEARFAAMEEEKIAVAAAKEAAHAKLTALGLTADEIAALSK